jgi:Zn-finger protein
MQILPMRFFSALLFGTLGLLLITASPAIGSRPGGMAGVISLDDATGVQAATIKLKQEDKLIREIRVKSGQEFKIQGLPEGKYRLVVEARLHTTFVGEEVMIFSGQVIDKKIRMSPAPFVIKDGPATKTILCSACHKAIYMEMIRGVGTEFFSGPWPDAEGNLLQIPSGQDYYPNSSPERLAFVSPITVATIAEQPKDRQDACRTCHAPTLILMDGKIRAPGLRDKNRQDGVTCADCHLDKNGNIHGKYDLSAPHPTIQDERFTPVRSAELCAACHQADRMAPGQQTVAEWKRDFAPRDSRTCQDCHMPQVMRLLSEIFSDRPQRRIGKHLFAGGHALPMLREAAALAIRTDDLDPRYLKMTIANTGAGHSIPTGHGPRAIIAKLILKNENGQEIRLQKFPEGMIAIYTVDPGLGKPMPFIQPAIRAGEIKELMVPLDGLPRGSYQIRAELRYDLDRTVTWNDDNLPLMADATAAVNLP